MRMTKGKSPVYTYFYTHPEPGEGSDKFGAFHSSEIPYALSTLDASSERNFALADRQLSLTMSSFWVNFVRNGNPNGDGLSAWAPVTATAVPTMVFGPTVAERDILDTEKLAAYRANVAKGGMLSIFSSAAASSMPGFSLLNGVTGLFCRTLGTISKPCHRNRPQSAGCWRQPQASSSDIL